MHELSRKEETSRVRVVQGSLGKNVLGACFLVYLN